MVSFRVVILICMITFHFSILIKGEQNAEYGQCEDMRQGFFNHYYCTLQCFGEVLRLSYIKGDLCEGSVELGSNTKEPVPLPVVGQVIECIAIRCKSAVPPSVCGSLRAFINKDVASQNSQPNSLDYQSNADPHADIHQKEENNINKDFKKGESPEQKSSEDTATSESVAHDNTDKKSNNDYYDVDFYYDDYHYDADYNYDNYRDDYTKNGKEITDEKQLFAGHPKKKSDEVTAKVEDAKYKASDDSDHDNNYFNNDHAEGNDSDKTHSNHDDLKSVNNKEVKIGKSLEIVSEVQNPNTEENVKQENKKDSSKQKSAITTSNQESKTEESGTIPKSDPGLTKEVTIIEKSNEDSTKEESNAKKYEQNLTKEENANEKSNEKLIKDASVVEKSKEDATKGGNVVKSDEELTKEESVIRKSDDKIKKEESIVQKSDQDSTKEEKSVKKSNKDSIKDEIVVQKSDQDSTKEKNIGQKANESSLQEENVKKSNEVSNKVENSVQISEQDSTKKETFVTILNEDSIKKGSIAENFDQDSTSKENFGKKANDESEKVESVQEKSREDSLKNRNDSLEKRNTEISSQNLSDENTNDFLSAKEGSSPTKAIKDPLQIESSEETFSAESGNISNRKDKFGSLNEEKGISQTSDSSTFIAKAVSSTKDANNIDNRKESKIGHYYYDGNDDDVDGFPSVPIHKNSDSNENLNADYQSNTKNNYPNYDTNADENLHQPNINLNYQPIALTEMKTFDKNDKYQGPINENTAFESRLGSKTNEFLVPNIHNMNNYQFPNNQEPTRGNYPIPNDGINPNYPNNNNQIAFQPAIPNKQQYLLERSPQHFNMPQYPFAGTQVSSQNPPLNPPVYQGQFVPYPYGNMDYNIRGQPGNQYSKTLGIPNPGNNLNIQSQNPGVAQKAPNAFWNPNLQTQNQQVLPPNNAQFMNYHGPPNPPVQHNVINTRVPSSQVLRQLLPWNAQPASAVIGQSASWPENMPSRFQTSPWFGPVNNPPAVKNSFGI